MKLSFSSRTVFIALAALVSVTCNSSVLACDADGKDKVLNNQGTILTNQNTIIANQRTIIENEEKILSKLDKVLDNQNKLDTIVTNQEKSLK